MNHRRRFDEALQPARTTAYGADEFVGQESFMLASEILALAEHAGVTAESSVLDLCCGVGGPGRLIARRFGCGYLGVDRSTAAVTIARERAGGLDCRFEVSCVPPIRAGRYDTVLLLETMLAFSAKDPLLIAVAAALRAGGRFAFTIEEGEPLTDAERRLMPAADTVWLTPLSDLLASLDRAGLRVRRLDECSQAHQATAGALAHAYASDAAHITAQIGRDALDNMLRAHLLWRDWLKSGRVRKFAVVVEKPPA